MSYKKLVSLSASFGALALILLAAPQAQAAITVVAPPVDSLFMSATVGGGSWVPLVQLKLQGDGATTLTSMRVGLLSTTTISNITAGELNRVYVYKESGAHVGFQPDEDILLNTGANVVTNPTPDTAAGTTITIDSASNAVSTTPTDYFIVDKIATSSALTINHAFYATTSANWINTSAGTIGSAFIGSQKVTLQKSDNLKISEVKVGSTGNAGDEFVELYNPTDVAVDAADVPLNLFIFDTLGGAASKALTYYKKNIPSHGYFLIASQTNYSGSTPPDAVYSTLSGNTLLSNTGLSISTSSTVTLATSTSIDRIAWGAEPVANAENTALSDLAVDTSYERKAVSGSTNTSMAAGGTDSLKGNSYDTNNNSADFVSQTSANVNPQNTASPVEFPFGGGGQDNSKLQVQGSFPGPNQTGVPIDIPFIGFGFNKMILIGTLASANATTTVTLTAQGSSTNLCTSTFYNPSPSSFAPPAQCNLSTSVKLATSTTYTFTVGTSVYDLSNNALDQDMFTPGNQAYQITFTTGSSGQTMTNITPPQVTGATPFPGSVNIPTNLAKMFVKFNQSTMDQTTLSATNITLTAGASSIGLSGFSYDPTSTMLSFVPGTLSANTAYVLTVTPAVKNTNGIFMPGPYVSMFTTGAGTDSTAPNVVGILPSGYGGSGTIPLNSVDFVFSTDDYLDQTTATSGAVTLSTGGNNLPGVVSYDPVAKEGHFTALNPLPANITGNGLTLTLVGGALRNISGTQIASKTFSWSTESANSDSTGPSVLYANADQFGIAITYNESVKATDVTNLANYSVTVGGNPITLSSMAGQSITYDYAKRTAKITGLFLQPTSSFTITVSNIKDISGNPMASASSFTGTVISPQMSGGLLGPGDVSGSFGPKMNDFSSAGIGFMPGMKVMPMNAFVSASTTYGFELPISKQIPASGKIVITFPPSADYGLCCAVTTATDNPIVNNQNSDINGPGSGTIGFSGIAKDDLAKTVTLTIDTATRSESGDTHDFLRFAVVGIRNPSIPKGMDSSGYTMDVKTKSDTGTLLESFTSSPVYISGGAIGGSATTTINGTVSGNGNNLVGVTVRMMSPQIGMLTATTNNAGLYQFTNIPVNNQISNFGSATQYFLSTDPVIAGISDSNGATTTAFFGEPTPTPVNATSTLSSITRDFNLTATSSAINFTVNLTGDNSANGIFSAGEKLDIFAGGPGKFIVQTYTTAATNYNITPIMLVPIPQVNGNWGIGIGPAMPRSMGAMNFGPPPAPSWLVPKPVNVVISGCPSSCTAAVNNLTVASSTFAVSASNRTISGILRDASGSAISSAQVYAFSPVNGVGNQTQTQPSGVFSIKVTDGSYNVGAFVPGMGRSREIPVVVKSSGFFVDGATGASTGSSGSNAFSLTIKKASYTITGRVTDGSNPVSNAPVRAYRTDAPGNVDTLTSSDGTYTLYLDTGTWKVGGFIPGFGAMTEQTVTIAGASQSNINFSPSTATTFKTISGTVFESADNVIDAGEGISGVMVRVSGANGTNEAVTGSDGTYSIRVPSGSYAFSGIFKPGYGKIAPMNENLAAITTIDATSDVTKNIRVKTRRTITIIVKDSNGSALTVSKAYIDLLDTSKNLGNHAEINNGTTTTIQIADGASTSIRAFVQGVPSANVSVASDDTASSYPNNTLVLSGVLEVNSNEKIKIVVNTSTASLSTVTGTVYAGSATPGNEVSNAWVQFVDPTNNVLSGTQTDSNGAYSNSLANGNYQVQAMKPGYVAAPTTVTVNGATTANIVVTSAGSTISGTVTAGGSAASDAYVWAEKLGGGFSSTKTSSSGTFSLTVDSGLWKVFAAAEGYQKTQYSSNVAAGASGISIALTSASTVSSKTATSNSFTDTSTGSFSDSTVGVGVSLDSGALGSAGNTSYLSAKQTSNVPQSLDTHIVASRGTDIKAVSGSSAVTNLQSGKKAEVTLTYTKAELNGDGITTTSGVAGLKVASWSDDKKAWESLTTVATYRDSSGNALASPSSNLSNVSTVDFITEEASHFSSYALASPAGAAPPVTPTGLAVSQSDTTLDATLIWTANTESDLSGYYIYRDTSSNGSFPLLANAGKVTNYTDTGLTIGANYYYKISAYNTSGDESAAGSVKSVSITGRGGGGSPSLGQVYGGGGGGGGAVTPLATVSTPATTVAKPSAVSATSGAQLSATAAGVSPVFAKDLGRGSKNDDVKRLQQLLSTDKAVYPDGAVNGNYGPATEKAVRAFQLKYGLIKKASDAGNGKLGPKTRAKLQEIFGNAVPPASVPATTVANPSPVAQVVSPVFNKSLVVGSRGNDVTKLQQLLATDKDVYPEGTVSGYLGKGTANAVKRFQKKYGISQTGTVGPATRAKLNELYGTQNNAAPAVPAPAPTAPVTPAATSTASTAVNVVATSTVATASSTMASTAVATTTVVSTAATSTATTTPSSGGGGY